MVAAKSTMRALQFQKNRDRDSDLESETHPVVIKHAPAHLLEDVAGRTLERLLDVLARLRARLDEEQALLLRPQLALLRRHFPLAPRARRDCGCGAGVVCVCAEVDLVPDKDAGEMWIGVFTDILQP